MEIKTLIESNLDFNQTYQAILQLKIQQLEHYQPIFSENMMTQYTNRPELLDDDALSLQKQIYLLLFKKARRKEKFLVIIAKKIFF